MGPQLYTLRHRGRIWRIPAAPFETSERLADRAWYIALNYDDRPGVPWEQWISESHIYVSEKYFKMKFDRE